MADAIARGCDTFVWGALVQSNNCRQTAASCAKLGLECHAGHGLTYDNVGPIAAIPEVMELNIGHFIIAQAVFDGLPTVVRTMKELMIEARK